MAVTIKDVAAKCGLSISTVSKAFNNYADISVETREAVQRAAREIGYYPNAIARTLKTNRSYNLGVLFQEERGTGLTHHFFATVLEGFKAECEQHGYDITFINHNIGRNGMTYLEHVEDNLKTYSPLEPCSAEELALLEDTAQRYLRYPLVNCTDCLYCVRAYQLGRLA